MPGIDYQVTVNNAPASQAVMEAIQDVEVESSLDLASICRLRLGIAQTSGDDWTVLEDDLFKPLVPLGISVTLATSPETLINAYVTSQHVTYSDVTAHSTLEVLAMDATVLMNLEEKIAAWPNLSDSDIATKILNQYSQYSLQLDVSSTSTSLQDPEGTPTQRGTDIRLLRRLALRNGFECHVQPSGAGSDTAYFGPPKLSDPALAVLTVDVGSTSNVADFTVRYEMIRPATATAATLDVSSKQTQPVDVSAIALNALGDEDSLGRIDQQPKLRPAQTALMHSSDLQTLAQAIVDRASWAVVAEGLVGPDVGVLRPGRIVNVRGAGQLFSGSYYLSKVTHSIGEKGYIQRFEARRNAVVMTGSEGYQETENGA